MTAQNKVKPVKLYIIVSIIAVLFSIGFLAVKSLRINSAIESWNRVGGQVDVKDSLFSMPPRVSIGGAPGVEVANQNKKIIKAFLRVSEFRKFEGVSIANLSLDGSELVRMLAKLDTKILNIRNIECNELVYSQIASIPSLERLEIVNCPITADKLKTVIANSKIAVVYVDNESLSKNQFDAIDNALGNRLLTKKQMMELIEAGKWLTEN